MRHALVIVVLAGLAGALSIGAPPHPPAEASCAGPSLDVARGQVVTRGQDLEVGGDYFVDGCNDYGGCSTGPGCDTCTQAEEETPMRDVALVLARGGRTWVLGETDADAEGGVTWTVTLPDDVRSGPARLVTDRPSTSVPVRVR